MTGLWLMSPNSASAQGSTVVIIVDVVSQGPSLDQPVPIHTWRADQSSGPLLSLVSGLELAEPYSISYELFPNPATDQVQINIEPENSWIELSVVDDADRTVFSWSSPAGSKNATLSAGEYTFVIETTQGTAYASVTIQ